MPGTSDISLIARKQFVLDLDGIHGEAHWTRVRENGLRLAKITGANPKVVELFALLHDSKRASEGRDPEHGLRAAGFARTLAGKAFSLKPEDLVDLLEACRHHSDGLMEGSVTVLTCWDADRLDLGRAGILPDPDHLCTDAARNPAIMKWAYRRSIHRG